MRKKLAKQKSQELKKGLEETIQELKTAYKVDAEIKVSVHDISDNIHASVYGNKPGWAASIIKLPVMVSALKEIEKGRLTLETELEVNHKYTLEPYDYASRLPEGSMIKVRDLVYHMIVESDNEATNILAKEIKISTINRYTKRLGLENTMLGHLLCPKVPRYRSRINQDGSNITCPDDMVRIIRHIYEPSFSKLSPKVRALSNLFLSYTTPSYLNQGVFKDRVIKSKVGCISDETGRKDIHEAGIMDDHLIVCIMLNNFCSNKAEALTDVPYIPGDPHEEPGLAYTYTNENEVHNCSTASSIYSKILETIEKHIN